MEKYVQQSLETHLFSARIMKEHSLFLMAGFPCKDGAWIKKADFFMNQFQDLLRDVVRISSSHVSHSVLDADEISTDYTIPAEERTSRLTGVPIDTRITLDSKQLHPISTRANSTVSRMLVMHVDRINQRAFNLVSELIEFKKYLLQEMEQCRILNANYPLLLKNIVREAESYQENIKNLITNQRCVVTPMSNTTSFWNHIMMEHALFIRGLLDPSECKLINTAEDFARDYGSFLDMENEHRNHANSSNKTDCFTDNNTDEILAKTIEFSKFKAAGTEGILNCKIASLILPLLADHVLREANHYIRLLQIDNMKS